MPSPLFRESGSTAVERREEADRLIKLIDEFPVDSLTPRESEFVEDCRRDDKFISPRALFWLRDIKDRYI